MVYAIEFDKYWEGKEFHTDAHSALLSIYDIFRRRNIPCFLLYRYKLPNLEYDWVNPRQIKTKFGITDPKTIDFTKINSKYVIIYHVEAFEKDVEKLREFINWCRDREIDVFIPLMKNHNLYKKNQFWSNVKSIISDYDTHYSKIKELQDEFYLQKIIERDLKLDDLLD